MDIVEVLKSLEEPMRLRIIYLLRGDTLCVCALEKVMNILPKSWTRFHIAGQIGKSGNDTGNWAETAPITSRRAKKHYLIPSDSDCLKYEP